MPSPITKTKNPAVKSVTAAKAQIDTMNPSDVLNSIISPKNRATIPPTVSIPWVGVNKSTTNSRIASAMNAKPAACTGITL